MWRVWSTQRPEGGRPVEHPPTLSSLLPSSVESTTLFVFVLCNIGSNRNLQVDEMWPHTAPQRFSRLSAVAIQVHVASNFL